MTRLVISFGKPRKAPPSIRPTTLDPLQVDLLAALVATVPPKRRENPMADDADIAAEILNATIAASLARVSPAMSAGVAGDCDECGEPMPRLIAGLCGFCRDGRRPPAATYDRVGKVPTPTISKETDMPTDTLIVRKINVSGSALGLVEARAARLNISFTQSVDDLILGEGRQERSALPVIAAVAGAIADAPIEELMAELGRRVAAASPEELAEANARAAAAETKLAAVTAALTGASA